jgi:hypothetical protein
MFCIILDRAEHDNRLFTTLFPPQGAQEIEAVHHGHVPVQQDSLGHLLAADIQSFRAISRFDHFEAQILDDTGRNFPHYAGIVDYQARFHEPFPHWNTISGRSPKCLNKIFQRPSGVQAQPSARSPAAMKIT